MLTLFHSPQSRSSRFIWLLEELGQPYEIAYVSIKRGDGSGQADPKNPNPQGKVPTLMHDGTLVTESPAICLYLTDAFPAAGLGPQVGDPDRAAYLSWLFWYSAELEPALVSKFTGRIDSDDRERTAYGQMVERFEGRLAKGPFILGEAFSAADILYGSVVQWGAGMLPQRDAFDAYLQRLSARPAFARAQARDAAPEAA